MRSFWNGTISFGLVNIPVSVFPATKSNELKFNFLHEKDLGRIHNERVCEKCGKSISYEDLVRGYEYQEDKYIPLTKEDFEKVNLESAKNISILDFVDPQEVDPMFFDQPYYLVPDKKGSKAYILLREALKETKKIGIAKLIFHTREHLAALKPNGNALMLDLMHFADEIKKPGELNLPTDHSVNKKELQMAEKLVENMAGSFKSEKYHDTYRENMLKLIEKKLEGKEIKEKPKSKAATNVIDIMSKLKASLEQSAGKRKKKSA
jgi:DNA end-binding protein Ku